MKSNGPYLRNHHQRDDLSRSARTQGRAAPKLLQVIGLFILGSIALLQQDSWHGVQPVQASRLHQKESNQIQTLTQEVQSEQQLLEAKTEQKEQGIFEKAMKKIEQKEEEERELKDQQFLIKQQNFIKATRQAMLLASQSSDLDDVQQVMKNMRMGDTRASTSITYEDRIKKIAEQQPEYTDEYEGFGSLTEMIKNQDKLADKELQEQQKKSNLEKMKAKMTEALSKKSKPMETPATTITPKPDEIKPVAKEQAKKEDQPVQKIKSNDTQPSGKMAEVSQKADTNSSKGDEASANVTKSAEEPAAQEDNASKAAPEEGAKNLTQLPALSVAKTNSSSSVQKPIIPQTALAENKNNNTATDKTAAATQQQGSEQSNSQSQQTNGADQQQSSNGADQQQSSNNQQTNSTSSGPGKLFDGNVSQVIDEVQLEQDAQQTTDNSNKDSNSPDQQQEQTTIADDSQQVQVESQIVSNPKKSIIERFKDQVNQDESDKEKAQELLSKMEMKMDTQKKKNVLDRESERLIREQNEDLQLDQDLNSGQVIVSFSAI